MSILSWRATQPLKLRRRNAVRLRPTYCPVQCSRPLLKRSARSEPPRLLSSSRYESFEFLIQAVPFVRKGQHRIEFIRPDLIESDPDAQLQRTMRSSLALRPPASEWRRSRKASSW